MYHKPVSVTRLDPDHVFLCIECEPNIIENDNGEESAGKKGYERRERDDEEEWGRIPIPQSDDSYSTEEWLQDESDQGEANSTTNQDRHKDNNMNYRNCVMAFLIAPRKDGRTLTKDGKILDVNE
jgi:hypothetical protein